MIARDKKGETGITSLILFIAALIIAASTIYLLLHGTDLLGQRAEKTAVEQKEKVKKVRVESIYGDRHAQGNDSVLAANEDTIQVLKIAVRLDAGSSSIDFDSMTVKITYGNIDKVLTFDQINDASGHNPDTFTAIAERDDDGSFDSDNDRVEDISDKHVMNSNDLIVIYIDVGDLGEGIGTVTDVTLKIIPSNGDTVKKEFITSSNFGDERVVEIYAPL